MRQLLEASQTGLQSSTPASPPPQLSTSTTLDVNMEGAPDIQIQLASDLHLERPNAYEIFEITPAAPHLALIGDIGQANDEGLYNFLQTQLKNFETVFFVLGNHEPYGTSWDSARSALSNFQEAVDEKRQSKGWGKFVVLDRVRFELSPTVTVLGCTLFSHVDPADSDNVFSGLTDFYDIEPWSVQAHTAAHAIDLAWLNEQVSTLAVQHPERQVIILTHHSPTIDPRTLHPKHGISIISSGFMTDLSTEICWTSQNVKVWAFGHTHFNCDFIDEKTGKRLISNQRGYYSAQANEFEPLKVFSLGDS